MVIYEVNLSVEPAIAAEYEEWLRGHIATLLALPGFESAACFTRRPEDEGAEPGRVLWTVHYRLTSRAALDRYFREHAPELRKDATARFGTRFSATRRVLEPPAR